MAESTGREARLARRYEAERRAREAAERAQRHLAVRDAVGTVLAEAALDAAPPRILEAVGAGLGWDWGAFWEVDEPADEPADERGGALRCVATWGRPEIGAAFAAASRRRAFARGRGLPGRVWASGAPAWVPDVQQDADFRRAPAAARVGLRGAVAVPVRSGGRVVGVLEFLAREARAPDGAALATLAGIGDKVGQFVARRRAEAALRASEARFRELFDDAPVGYQELDAAGRFVRVNRALCRMLGYDAAELLGRRVWALEREWAHGEPPEETRRKFMEKLATGVVWTAIERVRVRKDGTLLPVQVDDRLVRDAAGRIVGLRSAQVDLSARKRAEAERDRLLAAERTARAAAEAALRERDRVVAFLAHDLKNPLTGIRGHAQLLGRRAARAAAGGAALTPAAAQASLATIEATTRRMEAQIDDLLDAARLRAGQPLTLRRRPTDLVALARQVVELQQQATDRHRLTLAAAVPSLVGAWDPGRLERVLGNLLGNAIKYSPRGGEIAVEIAAAASAAVLIVRDPGVGIPAAELPHVFERFRRAGNVAGRIAGTGLGLAGARDIVEQHGGSIAVESVEGHGSAFTVCLPLAPGPRAGGGRGGRARAGPALA